MSWQKPWQQSAVGRFLAGPMVAGISLFIGLLSIVLSVAFFVTSRERPRLVYTESDRTPIVYGESSDGLEIRVNDIPIIGTDVTAATISLWNAGNQTVKKVEILTPLWIEFEPAVHILSARVSRVSRELTGFGLSLEGQNATRAQVNWAILEPNDGATIHLVFAGPRDAAVRVVGAVESQNRPLDLSYRRQLQGSLLVFGLMFVSIGLQSILVDSNKPIPAHTRWLTRLVTTSVLIGALILVVTGGLKLFGYFSPAPPY